MANGQNLRIKQETPQPQTPQQPASLPRPLGEIVREAPIREAPVKEGAAARRRPGEGERGVRFLESRLVASSKLKSMARRSAGIWPATLLNLAVESPRLAR